MTRYDKRLHKTLANAVHVPLKMDRGYVLMSDCHRGDGNWNDNFARNKTIYLAALKEYYEKGFVYFELGDGDELWENRSMDEILEKHGEVFELLKRFYRVGRLHMIYGNHDREKFRGLLLSCFPEIPVHEALILENPCFEKGLFLLHGHQGDLWNERLWHLTRFLVRYIWRPLEQLGVKDPTSAAKNYRKKERVEKKLAGWAQKYGQPLVAGHTHRPSLSKRGEQGWYFNTGSGVHPYSVTALEILDGKIVLVKWAELPDAAQYVRVEREVLAGPVNLEEVLTKRIMG